MTIGREGQPEGSPPIENLFPKDVLPTGRFLSALPGFDEEYPKFFPAKELSWWNGKTEIDGQEVILWIAHVHNETAIVIDKPQGKEAWTINEQFADRIVVRLESISVSVTSLLPDFEKLFRDEYGLLWAHIAMKKEFQPSWAGENDPTRPSELPLRTENMIDAESSWVYGFKSVRQVIEALEKLKSAIIKAKPIEPLEDAPPNPQSNRFKFSPKT